MRISGFNPGFVGTEAGLQTVRSINEGGRVELNRHRVQGSVNAGGRVESSHSIVTGSINAGGRIEMNNSTMRGSINAGGRIELNSSIVDGVATAGGRAEISGSQIGSLSAGESVHIETCKIGSVDASSIEGDIINSEIDSLTAGAARLVLRNSSVRDITLQMAEGGDNVFISGGSIVAGRVSGSVVVIGGGSGVSISGGNISRGGNQISVGAGGTSIINGYTVRATTSRTTVVTPDGSVYVNGKRTSGDDGPATYASYKQQNSGAPNISGPGWTDGEVVGGRGGQKKASAPTQTLVLDEGSIVSGKVVFSGGSGKIVTRGGSKFTGSIEGGIVEQG